jgi:hypothetical protein
MPAGWIIDSRAACADVDAPGAGQRQDRVRATDPGLTPGATDLAPACAGSVKQFPEGAENQSFGYPSLVLTYSANDTYRRLHAGYFVRDCSSVRRFRALVSENESEIACSMGRQARSDGPGKRDAMPGWGSSGGAGVGPT